MTYQRYTNKIKAYLVKQNFVFNYNMGKAIIKLESWIWLWVIVTFLYIFLNFFAYVLFPTIVSSMATKVLVSNYSDYLQYLEWPVNGVTYILMLGLGVILFKTKAIILPLFEAITNIKLRRSQNDT